MKLFDCFGNPVKEGEKANIIKFGLADLGRAPGYYYIWCEHGENNITGPYPTFTEAKEALIECHDNSMSEWLAKNPA